MDSEQGQQRTANKRRVDVALSMLLLFVPLLLYLPVLHQDFLRPGDDDVYVVDNPHVRTGLTLSNVRWAFTSFEQSSWHPVAWLSHMLDCQLFGLNAESHHAVNLLLHLANVWLLFWLLQKATGARWLSFFVALLFAVHPLNVETVAWIAQRKSLLGAFFSLLSVTAYGWYVRRGGWNRYLLLVFTFALALMAKPMAVSLPILFLLFDDWPLRRLQDAGRSPGWTRLVLEKIPLLAMSAVSSVLTEMAQRAGGSVMSLSLLPISTRIENSVISCVLYIGKILWPARLATHYPLQRSPSVGDVVASAVILIAITILTLYLRRFPYLAVGWFIFVVSMVPVIGIVQVGFQGMAGRYMYVPAVGLMIALVWGSADAAESLPAARVPLCAAAVGVVIALCVTTARYVRVWPNPATLALVLDPCWICACLAGRSNDHAHRARWRQADDVPQLLTCDQDMAPQRLKPR